MKTIPIKRIKCTRSSSRKPSNNSAKRSLKKISSFLGKIKGSPTKSKRLSIPKHDQGSFVKSVEKSLPKKNTGYFFKFKKSSKTNIDNFCSNLNKTSTNLRKGSNDKLIVEDF